MASTIALYTGLSGLSAQSKNLEVIGNNIANVNTTAFKSSRLTFADSMLQTLSAGTAPGDVNGGTNPMQVGLGVRVAGTQRSMTQGSITTTGNGQDLAIEGNGFFAVDRGGERLFTRAGGFRPDAIGRLTTVEGDLLLGVQADEDFVVPPQGTIAPIMIPEGLTIAEATENVSMRGNLNANGAVPTRGASINLFGVGTTGLSLIAGATVPPGAGNALETGSLLVEIEDPGRPGSGVPLLSSGQMIEVRNAAWGGVNLPASRYTVLAGSTVSDLMDFLAAALSIQGTGAPNPDGATPGLSLDAATGVLTVTGNTGRTNDLELPATGFRVLDGSGAAVGTFLSPVKSAAADGESGRTQITAYDSLGTPMTVHMTVALESKGDGTTTWRYYLQSPDDSDADRRIGTGTITFGDDGYLTDETVVPVRVDRAGTGAASPAGFNLSFGSPSGGVTALAETRSELFVDFYDGSATGTLEDFTIARDGTVVGLFSNSLTRPLARVAMAIFTNPAGLVARGSNLYAAGPNSGDAAITAAGQGGAGAIVSGALEQSNVDLGQEFINLILTSTGYSASTRVIRTADELMQQLLVLGR